MAAAARPAVVGFALAGIGYLLWIPLIAGLGDLLGAGLTVIQVVAFGAAAMWAARPHREGNLGIMAALLVAGAAINLLGTVLRLDGNLTTVNGLLGLVGWAILAWYAVLMSSSDHPAPGHVGGLRVGAAVLALGSALWIPFNLVTGTYEWLPGTVAIVAGTGLVAARLAWTPPPAEDRAADATGDPAGDASGDDLEPHRA